MNSTQDSTATQKSLFARYQEHITSAIFIGLVLGILTGLFLASRFDVVLTVTTLLGSIYMNALNMMIFPLVFCSIVVGITSIGNAKTTGKITGGAMIFFLFTTALASFVGLIIPRAINLGKGVRFEMATSDIEASKMTSILDTVKNLIPANPVAAFANGNMLQVLTFAVIIGFTLVAIGEKGEPLLKVIESGNEVCLKIISTVMYFTPIGVSAPLFRWWKPTARKLFFPSQPCWSFFMLPSSHLPLSCMAVPSSSLARQARQSLLKPACRQL